MTIAPEAVTSQAMGSATEHETYATTRPSLLRAHLTLGKVRLNALVMFTTALGFVVGSKLNYYPITGLYPPGLNWLRLFWTCTGTFLAAIGASAFNQALEAPRDARMRRTQRRPLCTGQLSRTYAAALGLIVGASGVMVLTFLTNTLTAALAATNLLLYIAVYTPLKPVSTINTLVGAVVGGVPPVLGWTSAAGGLTAGALVLGTILFAWQIPHFLALCWMYREDYRHGGFKMLPLGDATGKLTSGVALLYAALLMPLGLLLAWLGHGGAAFVGISLVLTAALATVAARFLQKRSAVQARWLFIASIIYLPLWCVALMADARGPLSALDSTPAGLVQPPPSGERFIDPSGAEAQRMNAAAPRATSAPSTLTDRKSKEN
jgi:heme o synthase